MIMSEEIITAISRFITQEIMKLPERTIAPDEALISAGLIDSFSLVDIALFIEETYGVILDDTELNKQTFDTLNELAAIVVKRMA